MKFICWLRNLIRRAAEATFQLDPRPNDFLVASPPGRAYKNQLQGYMVMAIVGGWADVKEYESDGQVVEGRATYYYIRDKRIRCSDLKFHHRVLLTTIRMVYDWEHKDHGDKYKEQ